MDDPESFDQRVLDALIEGFRARAGAKERFQALSEYEVARRAGVAEHSYAAYEDSSEREQVRASLTRLQQRGQVRPQSTSGRYETFVPVERREGTPPERSAPSPAPEPLASAERAENGVEPALATTARQQEAPVPSTFEGRLEEIIRLLRSIDARLERIERG